MKRCPLKRKGRFANNEKCECPVWIDNGLRDERKINRSLGTNSMERARRMRQQMEDEAASGRVRKRFDEATKAYLDGLQVEEATMVKYARVMDNIEGFAGAHGLRFMDELSLEHLDHYRKARVEDLSPLSWSKELQTLRAFFRFCLDRKWTAENPAKLLKAPRKPKPAYKRERYTYEDFLKFLAACDQIGTSGYERARARAMILLFYYYGFRLSDVALLKWSSISEDSVFVEETEKNGESVWAPMFPAVRDALDALPMPRGAAEDCPYLFWTGNGTKDSQYRAVARTLKSVFKRSGVERAMSHRFRHSLAKDIQREGGTLTDIGNALGDSPAVVARHYAKSSSGHLDRIREIWQRVRATPALHGQIAGASPLGSVLGMVAREGIELPDDIELAQVVESNQRQKR